MSNKGSNTYPCDVADIIRHGVTEAEHLAEPKASDQSQTKVSGHDSCREETKVVTRKNGFFKVFF